MTNVAKLITRVERASATLGNALADANAAEMPRDVRVALAASVSVAGVALVELDKYDASLDAQS